MIPEASGSAAHSRWADSKVVRLLAGTGNLGVCWAAGYLGDRGGLENRSELRGDCRLLMEWEGLMGSTLRGLPTTSPLLSFHSSSSFSMDSRLFTLDSFCRDSCSTACSVDSCLQVKILAA